MKTIASLETRISPRLSRCEGKCRHLRQPEEGLISQEIPQVRQVVRFSAGEMAADTGRGQWWAGPHLARDLSATHTSYPLFKSKSHVRILTTDLKEVIGSLCFSFHVAIVATSPFPAFWGLYLYLPSADITLSWIRSAGHETQDFAHSRQTFC